ncbi:ATP-binding protein [archaeon]|nr:MAG: ATP-binding protein [archaeon]
MTTGNVQANDCIGNLEHHIHKVFASIRVAGEEFVYCSSSELYSRLDDYCDDSAMSDMRPPVLIKGESGTGKTALLANWLQRREQLGIRMRSNADEFIFWHAVGCSRQSLNVNSMLRRLITDLKTKFELGRQVPKSQERLSWELPRFLELASKKGRVIIVIDGLHRLRLNDGSEDTLAWLPLTFPPNVRVILSVTVNMNKNIGSNVPNDNPVETFTPFMGAANTALSPGRAEDKVEMLKIQSAGAKVGGKKSRILSELDRRNIPSIVMRALDSSTCKSLVQAYIEKSINQEASKVAAGPFITSLLSEGKNRSDFIAGFLLFESQLDTLLQHKLGGNPLFLRLFLRCLHFLCQRGYSLWSVFEDWILSTSVTDLMSRILKTCEQGYLKTRDHAQRDCDMSLAAGGMTAIRILYPNHPAFRGEELHSASDVLPITPFDKPVDTPNNRDGHNDGESMKSGGMASVGSKGGGFNRESMEEMGKKEATALSSQVLQNLGDQEWVNVEKLVQKQLHRALIDSRRSVEDVILQEGVGKERSQFMFDVITKIKQSQVVSHVDSAESSVVTYSHPNVLHRQRTSLFESGSNSIVSGGMSFKQEGESNVSSEDEADNWDEGSVKSVRKGSPEIVATPASIKSRPYSDASTPNAAKGTSNFVQHALVHGESIQFISTSDSPVVKSRGANMTDPTEGFFSLPSYLRGGESVTGFGDLIGNALALLYVARQGLKEEELWKILGKLQLRKKQQQKSMQEKREAIASQEELMTKIARETLDNQGFLENAFMAEDIACRKYISMQKMYNAMKKALLELKVLEYRQLVDFVIKNVFNGSAEEYLTNFPGQPFVEDDHIHYEQFFIALKKLNRQFHFSGTRRDTNNSNKSVMSPGANEEDDSDFENFHLPSRLATAVGEEGRQTAGAGRDEEDDEEVDDNEDVRLGPVVEESLLEILCALGVLFSPENKVLILPSDSEPFRQTIYNRYILPRGGGSITYWHSLIIQYFRRQSNSLRKCEEMPWHLKICRKWSSLKDCLVDLKTFDLMFNNDLKDELMDYWRLLTEGPLYVIDPTSLHSHSTGGGFGRSVNTRGTFIPSLPSTSNKGGNDDDDEDNQSTLSHVLREIDEAHVTRMSVKDIKRKLMRFQVSNSHPIFLFIWSSVFVSCKVLY